MCRILFSTIVLILFASTQVHSQSAKIDSLQAALKNEANDTSIVQLNNSLSIEYKQAGDYDKALEYTADAAAHAKKSLASLASKESGSKAVIDELKKGLARAYNNSGNIYSNRADYDKALEFYFLSMEICEKEGYKIELAQASNNIGNIHYFRSDYPKALEYYFKSLKLHESLGNKKGMAPCYSNIGSIYLDLSEYSKSLDYYIKAEKTYAEIKNKSGSAIAMSNIGNIYKAKGDLVKALRYTSSSLAIFEEIGYKSDIALEYNNLGDSYVKYYEQDSLRFGLRYSNGTRDLYIAHDALLDSAEALHKKALELDEEMSNIYNKDFSLSGIGYVLLKRGQYASAVPYFLKAYACSDSIGALNNKKKAAYNLYLSYKKLNRPADALAWHELYEMHKDSVLNEEGNKRAMRAEMKFEYDKKEALVKAEQEKKEGIHKAELDRQTTQRNAFIAGFSLMLVLAGVSYRSYLSKQKANKIISRQKEEVEQQKSMVEHQKHIVEEKQKEILDSINYAKRIQSAMLPPAREVSACLPDSFVLYKPKDIVAGDFYWLEKRPDCVLFAAADCTGHGVPGAMVSVVCNNGLNRSVREHDLAEPGKILDKAREIVISEFEKSEEEVKDGMDISLCALKGRSLQWAGANNPLWIVRGNELTEIKADKQPIGKYAKESPFTTHSMELQEGDLIYIFTDGYADQFGGDNGKKFKYSKFKELLVSLHNRPMAEQRQALDEAFESWKGSLDQVDDVCVIGVRV